MPNSFVCLFHCWVRCVIPPKKALGHRYRILAFVYCKEARFCLLLYYCEERLESRWASLVGETSETNYQKRHRKFLSNNILTLSQSIGSSRLVLSTLAAAVIQGLWHGLSQLLWVGDVGDPEPGFFCMSSSSALPLAFLVGGSNVLQASSVPFLSSSTSSVNYVTKICARLLWSTWFLQLKDLRNGSFKSINSRVPSVLKPRFPVNMFGNIAFAASNYCSCYLFATVCLQIVYISLCYGQWSNCVIATGQGGPGSCFRVRTFRKWLKWNESLM